MKQKSIALTLILMLLGSASASAQSALEIFNNCRSAFVIRGATVIDFNWEKFDRNNNREQSINGKLYFQSSSFRIEYPGAIAAYSQGVFSFLDEEDQTLTYNRPTKEEMLQINLLSLMVAPDTDYQISKNRDTKVGPVLHLVPKAKGNIQRIELTVNKESMQPQELVVKTKDNGSIVMKVLKLKQGGGFPHEFYYLESKTYPKAEIIDLR